MDDFSKKMADLRNMLKWSTERMGEYIGVSGSTISKWENGVQDAKTHVHIKYADLAGLTVGQWLGVETASELSTPRTKMVPLMGEVQAGVWREAVEETDPELVPAVIDPDMPPYLMQAFTVRGTSMNKYYPDGAWVYVADVFSNGLRPQSGDHVLAVRRNAKGMYEASIKEFYVDNVGSKWLVPQSWDPEHQEALKFGPDTEEVTITGIVKASYVGGARPSPFVSPRTGRDGEEYRDKHKELVDRAVAGESLASIARDMGISRERARQIATKAGVTPKRA